MLLGAAVGAELGAAVTGAAVGAVVVVGANDRVGCGVEGEGVVGYSVGGKDGADGVHADRVVVHFSGRMTAKTIMRMRKTIRHQRFRAHKVFVSSSRSSRSLAIPYAKKAIENIDSTRKSQRKTASVLSKSVWHSSFESLPLERQESSALCGSLNT